MTVAGACHIQRFPPGVHLVDASPCFQVAATDMANACAPELLRMSATVSAAAPLMSQEEGQDDSQGYDSEAEDGPQGDDSLREQGDGRGKGEAGQGLEEQHLQGVRPDSARVQQGELEEVLSEQGAWGAGQGSLNHAEDAPRGDTEFPPGELPAADSNTSSATIYIAQLCLAGHLLQGLSSQDHTPVQGVSAQGSYESHSHNQGHFPCSGPGAGAAIGAAVGATVGSWDGAGAHGAGAAAESVAHKPSPPALASRPQWGGGARPHLQQAGGSLTQLLAVGRPLFEVGCLAWVQLCFGECFVCKALMKIRGNKAKEMRAADMC